MGSAVEWNDGRQSQANKSGIGVARRVFKVFGSSPDLDSCNAELADPTTGVGETLTIGTSTMPGLPGLLLDNVNITKTGNACIVTASYSNNNVFTLDIPPDPLDPNFASLQYTEEPGELVIPTIVLDIETFVGGPAQFPAIPIGGWKLGEPIVLPTNRTVLTLRGSANLQTLDQFGFGSAQLIHSQTDKLHLFSDGNYWRYRPRILRQESQARWAAEHEWVLYKDAPDIGTGPPIEAGGTDIGWKKLGDREDVLVASLPTFQPGAVGNTSLPAYAAVTVRPDTTQEPGPLVYPTIAAELAYDIDDLGFLNLPGVTLT